MKTDIKKRKQITKESIPADVYIFLDNHTTNFSENGTLLKLSAYIKYGKYKEMLDVYDTVFLSEVKWIKNKNNKTTIN